MSDKENVPVEEPSDKVTLESMAKTLERIENQNVFLQQQMMLVVEESKTHTTDLQTELKRFQTGAGKHAISSVFFKFLRDLIQHMNQIDELLHMEDSQERSGVEVAWRGSVEALQGNLETILANWGCTEIIIKLGEDVFDPNIHVAADSVEADTASDVILDVVQRGWEINGQSIQQPQVIVAS